MGCSFSKPAIKEQHREVRDQQQVEDWKGLELTVSSVRPDVPLDRLAWAIGNYEKGGALRVLRVEFTQLGEIGGARLGAAISGGRHARSLEVLRIAWCGIGSPGCRALAELLFATSSSLMCLDLEGNGVRSEGVVSLSAAIRRREEWGPLGSRFDLRLSENPIVSLPKVEHHVKLAELVDALRRHVPRRKRLAIASVGQLTPSVAMAASLAAGRFETMDLRSNGIEEHGAAMLADALVAARTTTSPIYGEVARLARSLRCEAEDFPEQNTLTLPRLDEQCSNVYEAALRLDEKHPLTARQSPFAADLPYRATFSCAAAAIDLSRASPHRRCPTLTEAALYRFARDHALLQDDQMINIVQFRLFMARIRDTVAGEACEVARLDLRCNPCTGDALKHAWPILQAARQANAVRFGVSTSDQILLVDSDGTKATASNAKSKKLPTVRRRQISRPNRQTTQYWLLTTVTSGIALQPTIDIFATSLGLAEDEITFSIKALDETSSLLVGRASPLFAWEWLSEELLQEFSNKQHVVRSIERVPCDRAASILRYNETHISNANTSVKKPTETVPSPLAESPTRATAKPVTVPSASTQVGWLLASYVDDQSDLRAAFDKFDTSLDGMLSSAELERGFTALGFPFDTFSRSDIERFISDVGCDNRLSFQALAEFVRRCRPYHLGESSLTICRLLMAFVDAGKDLRSAFHGFGISDDATFSANDLYTCLKALGAPFEELQQTDVSSLFSDIFVGDDDDTDMQQITVAHLFRVFWHGREQLAAALKLESSEPSSTDTAIVPSNVAEKTTKVQPSVALGDDEPLEVSELTMPSLLQSEHVVEMDNISPDS